MRTNAQDNPGDEIAALVRTLHETQQRLQALTGGEIDAVLLPGGQSYLLHEAQEKLRGSEAAKHHLAVTQASILNALPAHIAMLDRKGVILSVNGRWGRFAGENGFEGVATSVGQNYLEVCDRARGSGAEDGRRTAAGIRAILSGESTREFLLEYPCHSPDERRWFLLRVNPMEEGGPGGAVVMHVNITERKMAEKRLAASEALLRQFVQHTPAAIAMLDPQMRYIQVSDQWMQDYHLEGREIIGKSHYEIFPDLPEDWKEIHRRVLSGGVDRCDEASFPRADGSTEWLQWDVRPWHQSGGEIGGVLMFTQVITERKRAEKALRMSEERSRRISAELATVLDSSLDAICAFDAQGVFTQVSAACERMWGYRPAELLGTPYLDKVLPEDRAKTIAAAADIMAGKATTSFENRYVRKDGVVTSVMWSAWWSGAEQSMFCVARDRTEAHEAEARSHALAERLELAVKASGVGIWDWDLVTGILHWDDQMYLLYGASRDGSRSGVELWRRHLHPDDAERANAEIAEALNPAGRPFDTVFRIVVPPHGETRHIHGQSRVFRDAAGRPTRMLGTNWDVTAQVEREDILRQKLEEEKMLRLQATAGEKAKREFLAVMSHEIRTPMNGILGFAEMLVTSPTLSPEDQDLSRTILASGDALLRILDDILDFSRIEAGRLLVDKQAFSLRELLHGVEVIFAPQVRKKGLEFGFAVSESVPDDLLGDAGRIRQILVNLVGNAMKFTEHGSIRVGVRSLVDTGIGDALEFVIEDTGEGIAPDRLQAIFEAFTQADSSTARRHGGTGLGLTISRRLAELMGGTLRISSRWGEGTAFTLLVPLIPNAPARPAPLAGGASGLSLDAEFALRHPLRILVAEDDRVNLKLVVSMLRKLGYEPLAAGNGVEAVAACEREAVDCVLMDVQMPKMDGIGATRAIRESEGSRRARPTFIVALTANILPEDRQRCFEAGMNAYLNKPVKFQAIADALIEAAEFRATAG